MRLGTASQEVFRKPSTVLFDKSSTRSDRYRGIHTENSLRIKASIQEMYNERSSRKSSVQKLQRSRRYIKSAKSSRSPFAQTIQDQQKPIDLKYHSIVYESRPCDYSGLYFPARHKYVKSNKKSRQPVFAQTQRSFVPSFQSFNIVEDHSIVELQRRRRCSPVNQSRGLKSKITMMTKLKSGVKKLTYEGGRKEKDILLSPWETMDW